MKLNFPIVFQYRSIRFQRNFTNYFSKTKNHKFLFILSPPYCGSTLLTEIIDSSINVSVNNQFREKEGQKLPELRSQMYDIPNRWDTKMELDWSFIKKVWMSYWDLSKPVLLEKSPPNIVRATHLKRTFANSFFIAFSRDPYAHVESLMRRNGTSVEDAAHFAIFCLQSLKSNYEMLHETLFLRYEDLLEYPDSTISKIQLWMPELLDIRFPTSSKSHNHYGNENIQNTNKLKIKSLSVSAIRSINVVFEPNESLLNFFGYNLIESNV
jgi:hypothetical protein